MCTDRVERLPLRAGLVAFDDYSPQFPLGLMHKDFQLILKAAARSAYSHACDRAAFRINSEELAYHDGDDFSAVLWRMEEVGGIGDMHAASITG